MAKKLADRSEKELLHEIVQKLNRLIGILAIQGKDLQGQIRVLTALGLSSSEIGVILDKSSDYVRQLRSQRRKSTKKRKR